MSGITCWAWPFNKCNCLSQKYPQTTCTPSSGNAHNTRGGASLPGVVVRSEEGAIVAFGNRTPQLPVKLPCLQLLLTFKLQAFPYLQHLLSSTFPGETIHILSTKIVADVQYILRFTFDQIRIFEQRQI